MSEELKENAEVTAEMPVEAPETVPEKKGFFGRNLKFIIPGFILIIALLVGGLYYSNTRPEKVACKFAIADREWDYIETQKYLAYDYETYLKNYLGYNDFDEMLEALGGFDETVYDTWEEYCEASAEERYFDNEERYGEFTMTAKAKNEKRISRKAVMEEIDSEDEGDCAYIESAGFIFDDHDEYKSVDVRVYWKGELENGSTDMRIYLVPQGIGWKVVGSTFL